MPLSNKIAFCTTREAAQLLGVSLRTAQLWVESGLLEAWKTEGGHRRILRASVDRLLAGKAGTLPAAAQADEEPLQVLVVEDDNVLLKLYQLRIAAWKLPLALSVAGNGYEGLMRIGRKSPDLLILDLAMPGMDGFQMLHHLVYSPFREGMEIAVVTGLDQDEIADRGGLPQGVTLLPKPVPFARLREIVERLLRKREQAACLA
jgi:excisionase family DNA binding protein